MTIPRAEISDPLHHRPAWRTLNGRWDFAVDQDVLIRPGKDQSVGTCPGAVPDFSRSILVPYPPQSDRSGVELKGEHPILWYRRTFDLDRRETDGRVWIVFGAVDHTCKLWINGEFTAMHRGGYSPFRSDISSLVRPGPNEILLRVEDRRDPEQARGKQSWQAPFSCWYTENSGIWQSVRLEFTPTVAIDDVHHTATVTEVTGTNRGSGYLDVHVQPSAPASGSITVAITGEDLTETIQHEIVYPVTPLRIDIDDVPLWSPESPHLVNIEVIMTTAAGVDVIRTYAGFRRVEIRDGMLHLNGAPHYQRLVLDQGHWPDGLFTAPDDESIRRDIELAISMGFNGCRKHAKIEDPRFYYWADKLGYLVWEELPPAYRFTPAAERNLVNLVLAMVRRDRMHPSVIAWTLFNESWGVPNIHTDPDQQTFVRSLIETVRSLDPTRLVVGNDGWEHVGGDVYGLHSYASTSEELEGDLDIAFGHESRTPPEQTLSNGRLFQTRHDVPEGLLNMITEFGGTGYRAPDDHRQDVWGYDNLAESPEDLLERTSALVETVRNKPGLAGFVYTQLTDVEQEVNGLCFSDRRPKINIPEIRRVIIGKT